MVVGAAVLLVAFMYSMDVLMYPWAHALISHPTLTGGWHGYLRAASGDRTEVFGVYAQITHDPSKSYPYSDFDGQVHVCTPGGIQTAGRVSGRYHRLVLAGSAPFELDFTAVHRIARAGETLEPLKTPYLGLISAQLKGTWTKDTAAVAGPGTLTFIVRDGPIWENRTPSSEPLTQTGTVFNVTLKKGSEDDYRAECRGIVREGNPH
jgi:hypothetical protein